MRLFVAISLPEEVKRELEIAQDELRQALAQSRITWSRREQWHLTLRFLGNVEESRVQALGDSLRAACTGFGSLSLRATGLGCFPGLRRPRVLWTGVTEKAGHLAKLHRLIQDSTADFTSEDPETNYHGHITLARIKHLSRTDAEDLKRILSRDSARQFGEWTAQTIQLFRSELTPEGALHSRVLEVHLI